MPSRTSRKGVPTLALLMAALSWGCQDIADPVVPEASLEAEARAQASAQAVAPAPSPVVTTGFGGGSLTYWPFVGADMSGVASDPVNVLFPGRPDPRQLRAALMMLDGDRTAYSMPAQFPFDCTWKDAVGANQAAWAQDVGWTPSAIQLECGDFGPLRFHVRFFPAGEWTIANVHFELLITGTNEHRILSWELAEQLLKVDFLRSGLLDGTTPFATSGPINPAPSYREIEPIVYNGLPVALKVLLTGSPANAVAPVPVATDGRATILSVAAEAASERTVAIRDYDLPFNQMIPKPFCAAEPFDYILVQGAIRFRQRVVVTPSGTYVSQFHANGSLDVTPMNPLTTPPSPAGDTYRAQVNEQYRNIVTDDVTLVSNLRMQVLIPPSAPFRGSLRAALRLGPGGVEVSELSVRCGS